MHKVADTTCIGWTLPNYWDSSSFDSYHKGDVKVLVII